MSLIWIAWLGFVVGWAIFIFGSGVKGSQLCDREEYDRAIEVVINMVIFSTIFTVTGMIVITFGILK